MLAGQEVDLPKQLQTEQNEHPAGLARLDPCGVSERQQGVVRHRSPHQREPEQHQ
jgi:hypothetical protein